MTEDREIRDNLFKALSLIEDGRELLYECGHVPRLEELREKLGQVIEALESEYNSRY